MYFVVPILAFQREQKDGEQVNVFPSSNVFSVYRQSTKLPLVIYNQYFYGQENRQNCVYDRGIVNLNN